MRPLRVLDEAAARTDVEGGREAHLPKVSWPLAELLILYEGVLLQVAAALLAIGHG